MGQDGVPVRQFKDSHSSIKIEFLKEKIKQMFWSGSEICRLEVKEKC